MWTRGRSLLISSSRLRRSRVRMRLRSIRISSLRSRLICLHLCCLYQRTSTTLQKRPSLSTWANSCSQATYATTTLNSTTSSSPKKLTSSTSTPLNSNPSLYKSLRTCKNIEDGISTRESISWAMSVLISKLWIVWSLCIRCSPVRRWSWR